MCKPQTISLNNSETTSINMRVTSRKGSFPPIPYKKKIIFEKPTRKMSPSSPHSLKKDSTEKVHSSLSKIAIFSRKPSKTLNSSKGTISSFMKCSSNPRNTTQNNSSSTGNSESQKNPLKRGLARS